MEINNESSLTAFADLIDDSDSDNESLSDTSEDSILDILTPILEKKERHCIKGYVKDTIPTYTDDEFLTHFRVNRDLYQYLVDEFSKSSVYQALDTIKAYSGNHHMVLFLWFAGHEGCAFRDLADRFDLAIGTVSNMIYRVTMFLSSLSTVAIKWPNEAQKIEGARIFEDKTGIPNVIGKLYLYLAIIH